MKHSCVVCVARPWARVTGLAEIVAGLNIGDIDLGESSRTRQPDVPDSYYADLDGCRGKPGHGRDPGLNGAPCQV